MGLFLNVQHRNERKGIFVGEADRATHRDTNLSI